MNLIQTAVDPWKRSEKGPFMYSAIFWVVATILLIIGSFALVLGLDAAHEAGYIPEILIPAIQWFLNWVLGAVFVFGVVSSLLAVLRTGYGHFAGLYSSAAAVEDR